MYIWEPLSYGWPGSPQQPAELLSVHDSSINYTSVTAMFILKFKHADLYTVCDSVPTHIIIVCVLVLECVC